MTTGRPRGAADLSRVGVQVRTRTLELRGWTLVELTTDVLRALVLPEKGGDVLSVVWRPTETELLWQSPWGLRHRGAVATAGDSVSALMEAYPGGWQTVFPNGGDAVVAHGTEWGMHGEVWLTPFDWLIAGDGSAEMTARLVRSPFLVKKRVEARNNEITVIEEITNCGRLPIDAMWSQHPAFGAPLISADTKVSVATRGFIADDRRAAPPSELRPGARGEWPIVAGADGTPVDLRVLPGEDDAVERFGYCTHLVEGSARLENPSVGLEVELTWDRATFPYAWYWLECHATPGFPWYQDAYVFALEPATSFPGQGLSAVSATTRTQITFLPAETKTASVTLSVAPLDDHRE